MSKTTELLFRIVGAIVGASILIIIGMLLSSYLQTAMSAQAISLMLVGLGIVGAIIGFLMGPNPVKSAQAAASDYSSDQLLGVVIGGMLGLVAGALAAFPLSFLPGPLRQIAPLAALMGFGYLGASIFANRPKEITDWITSLRPQPQIIQSELVSAGPTHASASDANGSQQFTQTVVLLDTSVIIDGRITDISKTGFLNATLSVPNFVLTELQHIADSPDPIRRKRGRRGLEVLNTLRTDCPIPFEITDEDVSEVREVDSKLVALARHLSCPIMTNDYNLNRVAGLQGVNVLNINDLANAVKAAHLPGEELHVRVIQEGRENGQGVGYLEDGTMVVVEEGTNHMNETLDVVVTKVLQTSAGRMIFAKPPD